MILRILRWRRNDCYGDLVSVVFFEEPGSSISVIFPGGFVFALLFHFLLMAVVDFKRAGNLNAFKNRSTL